MTGTDAQIAGLSPQRQLLLRRRMAAARGAKVAADRIAPADRSGPLPLSFAQQRLWFLDQLAPGLPTYKLPLVLRLRQPVGLAALRRALSSLMERHEILRTRYLASNGVPYQVVDPPAGVPVELVDLSTLPAGEREAAMHARVQEQVRAPLDLAAGPAVRPMVLRLAPDDHVVMLDMHHISTDGWSNIILVGELLALYQGAELPPLPIQYGDFAAWQRERLTGEVLDRQLGYWRERLAGLPTLEFPTDCPRPAERTWSGASQPFTVPAALRAGAQRLGRSAGRTPLTVWLAAFQMLLSRYTGQDDIVLGSVFSGRTRTELEPLIGFFANTVVLRTDLSGNPALGEAMDRTAQTLLGAHAHQDVPFDKVVDALAPERDPNRNPLFQVCLVYQDGTGPAPGGAGNGTGAGGKGAGGGGPAIESLSASSGTSRFDLVLYLGPRPDGTLGITAEYSTELFDAGRITRLVEHYQRIVAAMVAEPDRRLGEVDLLEPAQRHQMLRDWNTTGVDYPTAGHCLHELFERQVRRSPGAVAARFGGSERSYAELNAHANRLAHELRRRRAGPERIVGVLLDRSLDLPTALLGVLKSGAAYLPLDTGHPAGRLAHLLADSGCRLVVTTPELAHLLPPGVAAVLLADCASRPAHDPAPAAVPGNLAYAIYTSGSTGSPKGVAVPHRSAVNYVTSIGRSYRLEPGERVLQFSAPTFDVSVFDLFGTLCHGATLVLAPRQTMFDPAALHRLLRDERITVAAIAPAMLAVLDPSGLTDLRAVCAAGEAYPAEVVNRWRAPGRVFHNGYGPTEATVVCVDHECPPEPLEQTSAGRARLRQASSGGPPIGRPMPNHQAYVVDRWGAPAPVGVPGELWIGGAGVARGYLGQPGLTAGRFVPDPFGTPGGRLYRTGDVAAWRPDGVLRFLGRVDDQVKIRGFRVEPGEVSAALATHPSVAAAVVVAADDGTGPRLVAYLVADGPALQVEALRAHLAGILPDYLVPAAFVVLPALPLTASGKVDRRALPRPGPDRPELAAPYVAPRTPQERTLARIWSQVLNVRQVGVHDNFFALGGDSIRSIQVVARAARALGRPVEVRDLFRAPTVAGLAAATRGGTGAAGRAGDGPLVPVRVTGRSTPLFCVHASGGSVSPYLGLGAQLDPDRPLYCLESPGLDGRRPPLTSIAEMARVYLAAIRAAQPTGPYLLGGWSLGGAVAYEMAGQLTDAGERVDLVALLDSGVPPQLPEPPEQADILPLFIRDLAGLTGAPAPPLHPDELRPLPPDAQIELVLSRAGQAGLVPDELREQLRDRLRVFAANTTAGAVWRPRRYAGQVLLLVAGDETAAGARAAGWGRFTDVRHQAVPGDHYTMLQPPQVAVLARLLDTALRAG